MARRGPKLRRGGAGPGRPPKPPSELTPGAAEEFRRLVRVMRERGLLDRLDIAVLAEGARIKDLLDRAHARVSLEDPRSVALVQTLTAQRRGLLREMGLTLLPSRTAVRGRAVDVEAEDTDPLNAFIKLSG